MSDIKDEEKDLALEYFKQMIKPYVVKEYEPFVIRRERHWYDRFVNAWKVLIAKEPNILK